MPSFLRQLDLTTALRPSLYDDELLLFIQDGVGLYEGKFKIPNYQNGCLYLTTHKVCYVDNQEPRSRSFAVDLKEIERSEFYAGFLKSSPKITLFPKPNQRKSQGTRSPLPRYVSTTEGCSGSRVATPKPVRPSPTPVRDASATWICPICGLPNLAPKTFDPSTANQHTPLPPCQACGIKPPLVHVVKAAIATMSNRVAGSSAHLSSSPQSVNGNPGIENNEVLPQSPRSSSVNVCPRCTFHNHVSVTTCEMCGVALPSNRDHGVDEAVQHLQRPESPGPARSNSILEDDTMETIKFSFRAGGEKVCMDKLKSALVQRKWLLQSAPPVPKPSQVRTSTPTAPRQGSEAMFGTDTPPQRIVGIAGLERRGAELRQNNQAVIGSAFEDLEALMTSAKEVIAMAEQFAKQTDDGTTDDSNAARALLSNSASVLGLVTTKDMLGTGSASETLYITELARNLAEFLTDDRRGILRKEGGIMSLVDLWAVFNRTRNGIELISPLDFEKAATMWEMLHLPIRLRRFKSGLLVVQEKSRTDEKTVASLLSWLKMPQSEDLLLNEEYSLHQRFGRGVTALETAEKFGWSVGVATEELEMAEETGVLCRDRCLDGTRFWVNAFLTRFVETTEPISGFDRPSSFGRLRI